MRGFVLVGPRTRELVIGRRKRRERRVAANSEQNWRSLECCKDYRPRQRERERARLEAATAAISSVRLS